MTEPGRDQWFGSALSGPDGMAEPVVKDRIPPAFADPTAVRLAAGPDPVANSLEPIVLPALTMGSERAAVAAMMAAPARSPRPTALPPRVAPRPTAPRPSPPVNQVHLPDFLGNFLQSHGSQGQPHVPPTPVQHQQVQAWVNPMVSGGLPPGQQAPPIAPPRPAAQPVRPAARSSKGSFIGVLIFGLIILIVSGLGSELLDIIVDLLGR